MNSGPREPQERYREEIRKGAALLDEREPGWRDRIAPADLELINCEQCVLGQVFGHYDHGLETLRVMGPEYGFSTGMNVGPEGLLLAYEKLTSEWLGYIKGEWS